MTDFTQEAVAEGDFLAAEHEVERQSASLRKELRMADLVLAQIAYVVGFVWLAVAGRLGPGHMLYWLPAVLLFYIPSGIVVLHLSQEMPLEGGLYQWAKLRLGALPGFLVAINLWVTIILLLASTASGIANELSYFAGPGNAWIITNRLVTMSLGTVLMCGLMLLARRGLSLGKWFQNAAGLVSLVFFLGMVLFALPRWIGGTAASVPVAFVLPAASLLNLNLLGKMGFGAFCGLDGSSIFSGECRDRDTVRTIRRSIFVAGPLIALIYIVGTACVLTFTVPGAIDMTSPVTQAFSRAAHATGAAGLVVPTVTSLAIVLAVGFGTLLFNMASRLPMVAGWDRLLPDWFSRLHPRFKTPTGSILVIGLMSVGLTVFVNVGVGGQEAFQTSLNAAFVAWAFTYVAMFSIPLFARGEKAPLGVRLAALSGLAMTLLYAALSIFPVVEVTNPAAFAAKVSGIVLALNAVAALYFMRTRRRVAALV